MDRIDHMQMVVDTQLAKLKALSPEEVQVLPEANVQTIETPGGRMTVSVYHRILEDFTHMVVLQVSKDVAFGLWQAVQVDGFVIDTTGTKRSLRDEETWEFT